MLRLVIIFCLGVFISVEPQNCPQNIFGRDNYFYILSDNQTNANNAQSICMRSAARLAEISSNTTRSDIRLYAVQRYIPPELILVQIYEHPSTPSYNDVFKFRPINSNIATGDQSSLSGWRTPEYGRLRSIRFYATASSRENYSTPVNFCWYYGRDRLQEFVCNNGGWMPNFILYGGSNQTQDTITVWDYNNEISARASSNLFLHNLVDEPHLLLQRVHYLPDIGVFIGARSDVNQSEWFWNNDTRITNSVYLTSNTSTCQQMSWPLTYDNGINLHRKFCDEEAYFVCQSKFEMNVSSVQCDGSSLRVFWNRLYTESITADASTEVSVTLQVDRTTTKTTWNLHSDFEWTISGLKQNITHSVQARIQMENCNQIDISAATSATTYYRKPEAVKNARIVSQNSKTCVLQWEYDDFTDKNVTYKLSTVFGNAAAKPCDAIELTNNETRYEYDLSSVYRKVSVKFQIQAFTCGGESDIINVKGTCNVGGENFKASTAKQTAGKNTAAIVAPVIVVLIVVAAVIVMGLVWFKRKGSMMQLKNQEAPILFERNEIN